MKLLVSICTILLVCQASLQAEDIKNTYLTGFETMKVFEFHKAWREKGNKPLKFPPRTGHALIVTEVTIHSAAANAGLQKNDIIRSINGKPLRTPGDAEEAFKSLKPQDEIKLEIIRRGEEKLEYSTLVVKPITKLEHQMRVLCSRTKLKNGITVIRHRESPDSVFAIKNFQLYYTEKDGKPIKLYLRIAHLDSNRLFTKKFTVLTENDTYEIEKKLTKDEYAKSLLNDINEINAIGLFSKLNPGERQYTLNVARDIHSGEKITRREIIRLEYTGIGRKIIQDFRDGIEIKREKFIDVDDLNRPHVVIAFGNYRLWEWYDEPLTKSQESMINDIAKSEKVILRYHGSNSYFNHKVAPGVRERMATVLRLFKANGGKLSE